MPVSMGSLSPPASGEALPMEQEFKQGYRMHRVLSNPKQEPDLVW